MAYLARFARPALYEPEHPTLGLPAWEHELLEAFVDNGPDAMKTLVDIGALSVMHADDYPNYYSHHEIDKVPFGRVVIPQLPDGEPGDGIEFTRRMEIAARERGVDIRTGHPVEGVLTNDAGEVVGVTAAGGTGASARAAASCSAPAASATTTTLRDQYLSGLLVPGCSVPTNQGVLVEVSKRLGAPLIHMNAAFMSPIQYEWVLRDDPEIVGLFQTPGDSMIIVNKYGRRIGNEKTSYNDRTIPHLTFDVERAEYGNLLSFALWDERTNTTWAGAPYGFVPAADGDRSFVVQGDTLEELADALDARLESLGSPTAASASSLASSPGWPIRSRGSTRWRSPAWTRTSAAATRRSTGSSTARRSTTRTRTRRCTRSPARPVLRLDHRPERDRDEGRTARDARRRDPGRRRRAHPRAVRGRQLRRLGDRAGLPLGRDHVRALHHVRPAGRARGRGGAGEGGPGDRARVTRVHRAHRDHPQG